MFAMVVFNDEQHTVYKNRNFWGTKEELIERACWRCRRKPDQIRWAWIKKNKE